MNWLKARLVEASSASGLGLIFIAAGIAVMGFAAGALQWGSVAFWLFCIAAFLGLLGFLRRERDDD